MMNKRTLCSILSRMPDTAREITVLGIDPDYMKVSFSLYFEQAPDGLDQIDGPYHLTPHPRRDPDCIRVILDHYPEGERSHTYPLLPRPVKRIR